MDWATWNWVDWLFVAVLLYGAVMGLIRGLSHELATLISIVVAVLVTRLGYEPLAAGACARWGWNEEITRLVAVVALALATLLGMRLLRIALGSLMTFAFKGWVERLGGLLVGAVRQGVIFLVILLAASFVPSAWVQREVMYNSATGRTTLPFLVEKYNEVAARARMIQADIPGGVEEPHAILPPLPEPDPVVGLDEYAPLYPVEE